MSQAVLTRIFALGGVGIGGLINYGATWAAERRKESAEAVAASRMLGRDLAEVMPGLDRWIETGDATQRLREDLLRFPAWKQYHLVAARSLPPDVWAAVSDAYSLCYKIRTRDEFIDRFSAEVKKHLSITRSAIALAVKQLEAHAGVDLVSARSPF